METLQLVGELAQYGIGFIYAVVILALFIQGKLTTEHRVVDWQQIAKIQEERADRLEETVRDMARRDEKIAESLKAINENMLFLIRDGRSDARNTPRGVEDDRAR